jgi:lysozyme family protein
MATFDACLKEVLRHEGGFVDHPRDPGGMTNLGVTYRTWADWTGKAPTEAEMRKLTPAKVAPLYRKRYWDKCRCDDLPPALALCVFDMAVNSGTARAAKYLQKLAGASVDGQIGPATIAATKAYVAKHGVAEAVRAFLNLRRQFYRQLNTFDTFGRGWLNRVSAVETAALRMCP